MVRQIFLWSVRFLFGLNDFPRNVKDYDTFVERFWKSVTVYQEGLGLWLRTQLIENASTQCLPPFSLSLSLHILSLHLSLSLPVFLSLPLYLSRSFFPITFLSPPNARLSLYPLYLYFFVLLSIIHMQHEHVLCRIMLLSYLFPNILACTRITVQKVSFLCKKRIIISLRPLVRPFFGPAYSYFRVKPVELGFCYAKSQHYYNMLIIP